MGRLNNIFKTIEDKKARIKSGVLDHIPFSHKRLNSIVPGVLRNTNYIVTAQSGVGKTQLMKELFLFNTIDFCLTVDYPVQLIYFLLEESEEEFAASILSHYLKKNHNLEYGTMDFLQGLVPDHHMKLALEMGILEKVEKFITVIDYCYDADSIQKYVIQYAWENGKIVMTNGTVDQMYNGTIPTGYYFKEYIPNDNRHTIVVTDHISLLAEKRGKDKRLTLEHFSANVCTKLFCKLFKFTNVMVQQQTPSGENLAHKKNNFAGPSLANLADSKATQRDAKIIMGLYDPARIGETKCLGHTMANFDDNFRGLFILKNRYGKSNYGIPYEFNGLTNSFTEL